VNPRGRYRFRTVDAGTRAPFAADIAALTEDPRYPIGDDFFSIDAGPDPFAFFDRLGRAVFDLVLLEGRVVGMSVRVLRRRPRRCWYLCGLKVHPEHRGQRLTARLARRVFLPAYLRCGRGYAVSMDTPGATENRIHRLSRRVLPVGLGAERLVLHSLDADAMRALEPEIRAHRGELGYLSLGGIKDIVLESTGAPMPLLHLQHGPSAERAIAAPVDGASHMFCAPEGDPLQRAMAARGFAPHATATCMHHRMGGAGWAASVLTSEI